MNKHTLNYHTRLHDWYRQHSIQLQKQEVQHQQQLQLQQQQQQRQQQINDPAGNGEVVACEGGNLTQDKLHAIHDWCADVNRNLFRVKKREAPPLFRRCRVTSASTVASRTSSAATRGRQQAGGGATGSASLQFRSADPRRVRSAEVFTMTGHWAKQPKAKVNGGELLRKRPGTAPRNIYGAATAQRLKQASTDNLDLCVRNSRDTGDQGNADGQTAHALPRVNHDSLHLRSNALILKQNGPRLPERILTSPRDNATPTPEPVAMRPSFNRQTHPPASNQVGSTGKPRGADGVARAKSAHPGLSTGTRLRFMDETGGVSKVLENGHTHQESNDHQRAMELAKNAKNDEYSRQRPGTSKVRGKPGVQATMAGSAEQTGDHIRALGADQEPEMIASRDSSDMLLQVRPGFCNTCSGIYSDPVKDERGDIQAASTGCGDCVHGINMDSTQQLDRSIQQQHEVHKQEWQRENYHIPRQRSASVKLSVEERLTSELKKTEMEVSRVESRLTENGIHYSAERADIREEHRGPSFARPGTSTTAQLRARLASQMALDEDSLDTPGGFKDMSEYSDVDDDDVNGAIEESDGDSDGHGDGGNGLLNTAEKRAKRGVVHVTIVTGRDEDSERLVRENGDGKDSAPGKDQHLANGGDDEHEIDCVEDNGDIDDNESKSDEDEEMKSAELARIGRVRSGSSSGRRKSISFTYKPEIAHPSVSNGLLNVLSIDDCKFHMRYSPHKILEEHEITENLMLPLALLQFNDEDDDDDDNEDSPKHQQTDSNSKVAMRISRGSSPENIYACTDNHRVRGVSAKNKNNNSPSPNTSIRSSTARRATAANIRKFKAMNDPDDIDYPKHQRPRSACLARAFHTLIHDRTVMQRFDNLNNNNVNNNTAKIARTGSGIGSSKTKTEKYSRQPARGGGKRTTSAGGTGVSRTAKKWDELAKDEFDGLTKAEGGPRYRLINAALRRHMGDLLQEQCKKFQVRYQRQRYAGATGTGRRKRGGGGGSSPPLTASPTPSLSLSLESLPQVRKGILKTPAGPGKFDSPPTAQAGQETEGVGEQQEIPGGDGGNPIANVEQ